LTKISARARLKYLEPLIIIGIAAAIAMTVFVVSLNQWQAYPWGFTLIFGIIMACGASFALVPIVIARSTENFLLGFRRTHWKLDQRVTIANGGSWIYPFHLPKSGWLGIRCNSDALVSVEITSGPDLARMTTDLSWKPEQVRRNIRNASVFYRAAHDGNWVIVIRNDTLQPANVQVKVSEYLGAWS